MRKTRRNNAIWMGVCAILWIAMTIQAIVYKSYVDSPGQFALTCLTAVFFTIDCVINLVKLRSCKDETEESKVKES